MQTVVSLCCIHWTANLSISPWWFLFGICKSDYLGEKAGFWKRCEMASPCFMVFMVNSCLEAGFTALLETFLSGQCIKTSNLFWVLIAAAADVGGGFLRKGSCTLRGCPTGKKIVVIIQLLNNSWVFWKTHWNAIVRKGTPRLWTFQNAQIVCLLQAYSLDFVGNTLPADELIFWLD